ncbi:MAG: competence protein competence protein ComFC [Parcubacteria group bacterium]|nr:competence protein competence protein ComFC [Parcubacteria group bacterium]
MRMKLISYVLDLLFPPRPTQKIVSGLTLEDISALVRQRRIKLDGIGVTVLLPYKDPRVRALILEARVNNNRKAQKILGQVVAAHLHKLHPLPIVLIPIPLSAARKRLKGYSSVERIAEEALKVERCGGHTYEAGLLVCTCDIPSQNGFAGINTFKNHDLPHPTYLYMVLDDVAAAGSSFCAAKAALEMAGAIHVSLLSLAR